MNKQLQYHCPPKHWTNLSRVEKWNYLKKSGGEKDLTFVVGKLKRVFKCHKWVLAIVSTVISNPLPDKTIYYLDQVHPDHFLYFLDFVYYNEASKLKNCSIEVLASILNLSKKFEVSTLEKAIIEVSNTGFINFFHAVSDVSKENVNVFPVVGSSNSTVIKRILANSVEQEEQVKKGEERNEGSIELSKTLNGETSI